MRRFDLLAFDVDGTLIGHPEGKTVWEILNRRYTGDDSVNRERLAEVRSGRLSYADWVELDVRGWREAGARREDMVAALDGLRLVTGAREALAALSSAGLRLVAISGTVDLLLHSVFPDHPFDEVYCNRIHFDDEGRIAGWTPTPFDMEGKGVALRAIAMRVGVPLGRCAFVGDSANDVWIAREAGFTVAFRPRSEALEAEADVVVRDGDLRAVVPHLLGG